MNHLFLNTYPLLNNVTKVKHVLIKVVTLPCPKKIYGTKFYWQVKGDATINAAGILNLTFYERKKKISN